MKNSELKFIFWGTPEVASKTLDILKDAGFTPSLIITQPDRPQGRKMLITPPPVKTWAIDHNVPYLQPEKIDAEFTNQLPAVSYDLSIVVAYGNIIPENILNHPKLGSLNIHYSLLPKYRGASPVESAILNGDKETGVTIQKMVFKLDAGPILALEKIEIKENETTPELKEKLIKAGGELLVKTIPDYLAGNIAPETQNENEVTTCGKIKKEDGLLNLEDNSPVAMFNKYRAYKEWPRTFFFREGKRFIITKAHLGDGRFVIEKVIPEGGKEQDWN